MGTVGSDLVAAPVGKRLVAFAWDYLWISLYIIILATISTSILSFFFDGSRLPSSPILWDAISFLTLVLPVICYFALQESSPRQATWGKRKANLIVTSLPAQRLSPTQAFTRSFIKFLPWQIAHTSLFHIEGWPFDVQDISVASTAGLTVTWILVGFYLASILFSKSRRTLYDWAGGSIVTVAE